MTDRIARAEERLRIAARLYQLGLEEESGDCFRTAISLCGGARLMAEEEGRVDLAGWAMGCENVCFEARWSFGGAS